MLQDWFLKAKLGIFIHWGIYSVKPTTESWPIFNGEISYEDYMDQCKGFTAENYDPEFWAECIKQSGALYAVLTAKHHDGVALWDTKANDLSVVKQTPARRDLVGPFCAALRKRGIKVGLYYSHLDWSNPDYASLPVTREEHEVHIKTNRFNYSGTTDRVAWERFLKFHRMQIKELCNLYQPDLLWFDGEWERSAEDWRMQELRQQLDQWAPQAVLNQRMHDYGDYKTPEQALPIVRPDGPWELCMTMNDHFCYLDTDTNYKSPATIVRLLMECVSQGGNLLLGIATKADGTYLPEYLERLAEIGKWIRKNKSAVIGAGEGLPYGHYQGLNTVSLDKKTLNLFLFDSPKNGIFLKGVRNKINRIVLEGAELSHTVIGGAPWHNIPGIVNIHVPSDFNPGLGTPIHVELQGPLDLYRGQGGAIVQN